MNFAPLMCERNCTIIGADLAAAGTWFHIWEIMNELCMWRLLCEGCITFISLLRQLYDVTRGVNRITKMNNKSWETSTELRSLLLCCYLVDTRGYLARKRYRLEMDKRKSATLVIQRGESLWKIYRRPKRNIKVCMENLDW